MKHLLILMVLICGTVNAATVSENLASIASAVADIKIAAEAQGITIGSTPLSTWADKIVAIPSITNPSIVIATLTENVAAGDMVTLVDDGSSGYEASKFTNPLGDAASFSTDILYFGFVKDAGTSGNPINVYILWWREPAVPETDIVEIAGASTAAFTVDVNGLSMSSDGSRIVVSQYSWSADDALKIYDAQGDNTWAIDYSVTLAANNPGQNCAIADDKSAIICSMQGASGNPHTLAWRWNGSGYSAATLDNVYSSSYQYAKRTSVSPDGSYMAVGQMDSPRITLYKWDGDSYADVSLSAPTGATNVYPKLQSNDALFLGINDGQRFTYYKDISGTWTIQKLLDSGNLPSSSTVPPGVTVGVTPQRIVLGGAGLTTYSYNSGADDWDQISTLSLTGIARSMAMSDDGTKMAVCREYSSVFYVDFYSWDGDSWEPLTSDTISNSYMLWLDMSDDGSLIAVAGRGFGLKLYEPGA